MLQSMHESLEMSPRKLFADQRDHEYYTLLILYPGPAFAPVFVARSKSWDEGLGRVL